MDEDKNTCQFCEEIIRDRKFPECFGNVLNAGAFVLISVIIILFLYLMFPSKEIVYEKGTDIKISLTKSNNPILDSIAFNNILDIKLKEFEDKIEKAEKKRTENLKYYGTLIGLILSIVGFFGFKSIHDTRQAAIEKSVFDAKKEAKTEASEVAKKTAKDTVKSEIGELTKNQTINYLDNNLQTHLEKIEQKAYQNFHIRLDEIKKEVDVLMNPRNFNENEIPVFYKNTEKTIIELLDSVKLLEKEIYDFKNQELRKSIISEIKKND
jgi:hypothetical protein